MGTVLVPSSSPLTSDVNQRSYQIYSPPHDYDVAHIPGLIHSNTWSRPNGTFRVDSLTAPSGFVSSSSSVHASSPRPWGGDDKHVQGIHEEGPPRKRVNRGPTQDQFDVSNSPGSPEVKRPGQRRRVVANSIDALSSSDESVPDVAHIFAGPSKPRIVRGRPSGSPGSPDPLPSSNPLTDPKFIRFKYTMPQHTPTLVQMAWLNAHGDVKKATELLSDPHWDPRPPVVPRPQVEDVGRVKEIEEATKAERAAAKEKGKKSMIYANRSVLDNKPQRVATPPPSQPAIDLTASSPLTPAVAPPRGKRIKKMVLDSESEPELTDSDDERNQIRGRQDTSNDARALDYFNTTGPEALQELTGMFAFCYS